MSSGHNSTASADITQDGVASPFTQLLESEKRLSQSLLWQAQRKYFERVGIDAWRTNAVPHYVTNNPRLASSYAEIALGYFIDCRQHVVTTDVDEPVYIVELGAGSGRFGFFFIKVFSHLLRRSSLSQAKFCYVMTDFTESNLGFLRSHDALQPFVENGVLDFALFDIEKDKKIRLERSGATLGPGLCRQPLIVIANYVFDGISQDAFFIKDKQLFEHLISLYADEPALDLSRLDVFEHLAVTYTDEPARSDYYPEPEFNDILRQYTLDMLETTILFPCAALRCVRQLAEFSAAGFLLLSGDKGEVHEDFLDGASEPGFTMHGSFSMQVNYHAIAEYIRKKYGCAMLPEYQRAGLNVAAFLMGGAAADAIETRMAYERAIGSGAADDFFVLRRGVQEHYDKLEMKHIQALLRLSGYDPKIMHDCFPVVWSQIDNCPEPMRAELSRIALRVWDNYYHLSTDYDLAFDLGCLLYGLDEYQEALRLFQESSRLWGDDPRTFWNQGLCFCALKRIENAVACFSRALESKTEFQPRGGLQGKGGSDLLLI